MFRITNNFKILNISKEVLNRDTYIKNSQSVRWRKPRWIPQAKSKIFRVPVRKEIPEDEKIELRRLTNSYNTQVRSIRRYFLDKYKIDHSSETDPEEIQRQFEEDFTRCMELNNKWNEEQKVLRERRVAEKFEAELEFARNRLEQEKIKQEQKMQMIEEIVRKEKELSETYITPENIDAAIEHALANQTDYNYAITLNGDKVTEYEHEKRKEQQVTVSQ